LSHSKY